MGSAILPNQQAVVGPTGAMLTLDQLPPAGTFRWVARRKA